MSCKCNCKCNCTSQKGERGLQGVPGEQGIPGPEGPAGGGIVNKINSYAENIESVDLGLLPGPYDIYMFPSVGYQTLSYTNTTGADLVVFAQATWDAQSVNVVGSNEVQIWVDGAIIRTTVGVDTIEYQHQGPFAIIGTLFDSDGSAVSQTTTEKVVTTSGGFFVEYRATTSLIPENISIFKKLTLVDGETVSLKFRTKNAGAGMILEQAQFFVQQLDS